MRAFTALMLFPFAAWQAMAHEGHDASGPHLHGWDGAGLLVLMAVVLGALWWAQRGRK
jgi:hypothetical protein